MYKVGEIWKHWQASLSHNILIILGEGWCEGDHVVCPVHRWKYNVENGRGVPGQGDYVDTFPTRETEEGVFIGLKKDPWWKIW